MGVGRPRDDCRSNRRTLSRVLGVARQNDRDRQQTSRACHARKPDRSREKTLVALTTSADAAKLAFSPAGPPWPLHCRFCQPSCEDRDRNRRRPTCRAHKRDASRTRFIELEGYRVFRFWNNEVLGNIDGVLEMIQTLYASRPPPLPLPTRGRGKSDAHNSCPTSCSNCSPRKSPRACRRGRRRICARRSPTGWSLPGLSTKAPRRS